MTSPEILCTVDPALAGHVRELLADAGIDSDSSPGPDEQVTITVAPDRGEHARSVIGLVLPHLLDHTSNRLSDRLIRTEHDPPPLPGGLLDARPSYGYPDPLADEPGDDSDDDEEFVPPAPPPLPRPRDRIEKAAWAGLVVGPLLLVAVQVFGLPGVLTPIGLLAFLGGFVAVIARMEDRPRQDDGWDDGAVV